MSDRRDGGAQRLWIEIALLHAIGLPLALGLGYLVFRSAGPMAGAAASVALTLAVVALGIAHLVRRIAK